MATIIFISSTRYDKSYTKTNLPLISTISATDSGHAAKLVLLTPTHGYLRKGRDKQVVSLDRWPKYSERLDQLVACKVPIFVLETDARNISDENLKRRKVTVITIEDFVNLIADADNVVNI